MDNYQKVEQLVNKAGCSYEDAKAALEANDWDMLDAVISLEKDGKIIRESAEQKTEEPIEIIPEVSAEKVQGENSQQIRYVRDEDTSGNSSEGEKRSSKRKGGLWKRIKSILMKNRMLIFKSNGNKVLDVPILVPIIALICFFWATLILAGVAMLFGFRFHFEGEDLGKTNINSTMDKATDYAEKVKNDIAGKVNDKQNTDN